MSTRRLTAVMFTDIVGYTAMMQADEASSMAKVSRFREVVARQVEAHQGKLIEIRGDGSLSIFSSATEAVACAKHIQESLREAIPLRIGIHSGDVVERDGQIFGDAVNIASRIESLGVPGTVLTSSNIAKQIKNKADFEMTSLGKFHFKNVDEPMEIFALANEGFVVPKRSEVQGKLKQSEPSYLKWAIPIAALVLMALFAAQSFWGNQKPASDEAAEEKTLSIAVLPFRDLSPNGDQEYFSDGVSEELLNVLAKVNKLEVASRTSSFVFKREDRNIQDIAEILEVDYVLEGSVRKSEEQLRITAQLIDAETDRHIWSETYDRQLDDIFALQDELAGAIVKEVNALVGNGSETILKGLEITTSNENAYDLYLQAKNLPAEFSVSRLEKQIELLELAVGLDSLFVDAWVELVSLNYHLSTWPGSDYDQYLSRAKNAYQSAIKIAPDHPTLLTLDALFDNANYQWETALPKLVAIEKTHADIELAYTALGTTYLQLGYSEEAIAVFEKALKTIPERDYMAAMLGRAYLSRESYASALECFIRARELGYQNEPLGNSLIINLKMTGHADMIRLLMQEWYGNDSIAPLVPYISKVILSEGKERALAVKRFEILVKEHGLEHSSTLKDLLAPSFLGSLFRQTNWENFWVESKSIYLAWVWSPALIKYRQSESFKNYIREANVLAYWQKHGFPPQCRDLGNGDFECD